MKTSPLIVLLSLLVTTMMANDNNPEELGKVEWLRDLSTAQKLSQEQQKPLLILFQEIPGCSTCKRYGNEVLSHPLLVEAVETLFIPLAIFNNRKGKDAIVLQYFAEPSWNNPVVRIVDANKKDILPRLNGNYTPSALAAYMVSALEKAKQPVPVYLSLIEQELRAAEGAIEKTTLSMYCFWTGEKELGKLDGVVHTEAGFMDGHEVVNVYYDPNTIQISDIVRQGASAQCADKVYATDSKQESQVKKLNSQVPVAGAQDFRLDRAPKYYLSKSIYRYVPMSPIQAVKANALVGQGKNPSSVLSPRQLAMVESIQKGNDKKGEIAIHNEAWKELFFTEWEMMKEGS